MEREEIMNEMLAGQWGAERDAARYHISGMDAVDDPEGHWYTQDWRACSACQMGNPHYGAATGKGAAGR